MPSLVFASIVAALTLLQTPAPAPDFSGTWTMDRSRSQTAEAVTLNIKQTVTEIVIETTRAGATSTRTYPIEATPHAPNAAITAGHSHAYWDHAKLVTEVTDEIQGQAVSFKQTRSLNEGGTEMTIESLTVVQHGYSLSGGQNYSTAKDVYLRSK
jgi:hypothetical protein